MLTTPPTTDYSFVLNSGPITCHRGNRQLLSYRPWRQNTRHHQMQFENHLPERSSPTNWEYLPSNPTSQTLIIKYQQQRREQKAITDAQSTSSYDIASFEIVSKAGPSIWPTSHPKTNLWTSSPNFFQLHHTMPAPTIFNSTDD